MWDFVRLQKQPSVKSRLTSALQRKGAYRNFREVLKDVHGEDTWYSYRLERLHTIAKKWCQDNRIFYYYYYY